MDETARQVQAKRSDWTLAYVVIGAIGVVALLALATAPVAALLGDSSYAVPSALHGVAAITFVIVATVAAYLGYRLYMGRLEQLHDLRILASFNAFFSLLTIMFGNWVYIAYRAKGGPRTYFLENNPVVHQIFFEFKEFIALFTLPLSVAAAFILLRHRDELLKHSRLRQAVAVALGLSWLYLMLAFALGAAITKLRSV